MIRVAENILRKNWTFAAGNPNTRPIKETKIPGGVRVENENQNILSGYFYPAHHLAMVNPFSIGVSMTLKCSISRPINVKVEKTNIVSDFNLVAQEAVEVLMVGTVSESIPSKVAIILQINNLPVGEWLEITDPHFFLSTEKPDIWTPAHADLTPEQIALMKYGEFTEARQI